MELINVIKNRRTVKPERFTGEQVPDEMVWKILESANWAPTHGHTEPWRFVVFNAEKKQGLLEFLIQLDERTNGVNKIRADKKRKRFEPTSHIIGIGVKRGENPKIPFIEEQLAVAMAVQNMWLTAFDLGFGGYWSTGSLAYTKELTSFFGLDPEADQALGFFYLGVPKEGLPPGHRLTSIKDKVSW